MKTQNMNKLDIRVLDKGFVTYVDHYGSDSRIVESARVSYDGHSKGDDQDKRLLFYLYKNKHSSPLEQSKITFKIKMPLFVAGQFVRHRMQNLNFCSYRYTEAKEEFYIPDNWRRQDNKNKQSSIDDGEFNPTVHTTDNGTCDATTLFVNNCKAAYQTYCSMIESGVSREMARMILPQNLYTECYSCWDLNNLLKFFSLRDDSHAQYEIQEYARAMKHIVRGHFPWVMEAYDTYSWELKEVK